MVVGRDAGWGMRDESRDLKQFAWFDEPFSRVLYRRVALP